MFDSIPKICVYGLASLAIVTADTANAVYLNDQNISVTLGASMSAEPFENRSAVDSLASIIDAPSADASEFHTQSTHVWDAVGPLELDFDLQHNYDLTTLHFWNYFTETYDVDTIDLLFYDSSNTLITSQLGITPALGGPGSSDSIPIEAQDIAIVSGAQNVRFVNAVLTGTNGDVDFNNLGFTADLQGDLDGNGFVGIDDLNLVLGNWNQDVPPADPLADPSGDGFVGIADLNKVLGNWNAGLPPAEYSKIPEPASLSLALVGSIALLRRAGR